jgi:hypothetical protein
MLALKNTPFINCFDWDCLVNYYIYLSSLYELFANNIMLCVLQEGEPNDPQLKRLQREIDEVNRLFDEWERRAAQAIDKFYIFNTFIL